MKRSILNLLLVFCLISFLSCGSPDESTHTVPVPISPENTTPPPPYPTPVPPTPDSRLPDLGKAAPVRLTDSKNFSGLEELAGSVFLPLVGDSLVHIQISGGRDRLVQGSLLFAFEDREGFWGAKLNSFEETGIRTSKLIDMIFADNELIFRAISTLSGDTMDGMLFYRIREEGDTACVKVAVVCEIVGPFPSQPFYPSQSLYPPECNQEIDVNAPCRAYMSTQNASVKELGTFRAKYSNWVVN